MTRPRLIVTGASGFVGRHLLDALRDRYEIFALARRSYPSGALAMPASVRWFQVDIGDREALGEVFEEIRRAGSADVLIHLAGHYDFTGERHEEYRRTNVDGMRNVLDATKRIGVRDFVFASSVAACQFPRAGEFLSELSRPDGPTPYAESKRAGEEMLPEYRGSFRTWIVRFGALFSDWCEYEPLFRFLETWLARPPRSRVLAGRGMSAVPYLHVRDAVALVLEVLGRLDDLDPDDILLSSPDGATSHLELFEAATAAHFGRRTRPILMPRPLCALGLRAGDVARRALGVEYFMRPWMGEFIDLRLAVDAHRTREKLGWAPRPRLDIVRRMPFLVQNRKASPAEWQKRNHAALKGVRRRANLTISKLLTARAEELSERLTRYPLEPGRVRYFPTFGTLDSRQHRAANEILLAALIDAVRTGEKRLFAAACRDLASRRRGDGFSLEEIAAVLDTLSDLCVLTLAGEDSSPDWSLSLYDHITMTVQFGVDEVHEVFEGAA